MRDRLLLNPKRVTDMAQGFWIGQTAEVLNKVLETRKPKTDWS